MNPVFEAYTTAEGQVSSQLALRSSWSTLPDGFHGRVALKADLQGSVRRNGVVHGIAPLRARWAASANGLFAGQLPMSSIWTGAVPAPSVSVFNSTLAQPARLVGSQRNAGQIVGRLALSTLVTQAGAAFRASLAPSAWFIDDNQAPPSRSAFCIQPLAVVARVVPGLTIELADRFEAGSHQEADFIHALLELFTASDSYTHAAEVLQALADGASLADVAQMIIAADLLDSFVASAVQTDTAQITVLLADGMLADDSADPLSVILAVISDGFYASLTIATGEDGWTAWVMTTQTKAMRRYTNWAFNSYAVRDEVFLGAGEDGIYRMGGDKDAGAAIRWAIRTGKLNFANGQMKSIPLAYIGVTSRGDILLRVRATTIRGVEVEQTYRMSPSTSTDARERRVKVGQGFRSVYWVFEIANDADGEAATIHEWHALPVKHTGKLI